MSILLISNSVSGSCDSESLSVRRLEQDARQQIRPKQEPIVDNRIIVLFLRKLTLSMNPDCNEC